MGLQPNYQTEAQIYAKYILKKQAERQDRRALPERRLRQGLPEGPQGRPRRQGQADDRGRGLPTRSPTRRSTRRSCTLQGSGADIFINITTPKFAAQAIRKAFDIGWKPLHYPEQRRRLGRLGADAGRARQVGRPDHRRVLSRTRPTRSGPDDPAMLDWRAFMKKYYPEGEPDRRHQRLRLHGRRRRWSQVLKQCGDDLTRENVMKQAANLKDFAAPTRCCPASRSTPGRTTSRRSSGAAAALRRQDLGALRPRDLGRRQLAAHRLRARNAGRRAIPAAIFLACGSCSAS